MMNAATLLMWLTSHPKFWPKNPVTNVSGRKIVCMHRAAASSSATGPSSRLRPF